MNELEVIYVVKDKCIYLGPMYTGEDCSNGGHSWYF